MKKKIKVIIPAYNEEQSIAYVINDIPKNWVNEIIVCNNASTDQTAQVAAAAGATVVHEDRPGYGQACLTAMDYIKNLSPEEQPEIIVFMDGDYSDFGEELPAVIAPIINDDYDMVIGSRALGNLEKGAMMPAQIFGNWLATTLIRLFYNYEFTDLGPFRAVKWQQLLAIDMQDRDFGWTVEMQVKAAKYRLKSIEIPVSYRKRVGISKISGTVKGTFKAGHKILWTIFKLL